MALEPPFFLGIAPGPPLPDHKRLRLLNVTKLYGWAMNERNADLLTDLIAEDALYQRQDSFNEWRDREVILDHLRRFL